MKNLEKSLALKEKMEAHLILRINEVFVFSLVMLFSCVFPQYGNAQEYYYGKDDFGKLTFMNDSLYCISVYGHNLDGVSSTGFYHRNGDTLFLNSTPKRKYEIEEISREDMLKFQHKLSYLFMKEYIKEGDRYYLWGEGFVEYYNEETNEIFISDYYGRTLVVLLNRGVYDRLKLPTCYAFHTLFYKIKITKLPLLDFTVFLDEFPLLIKRNKLIPIDKKKNEDCWVNNGFYFPKMKKSKDEKPYKVIGYWYKGLVGLPTELKIPKKPYWVYPQKSTYTPTPEEIELFQLKE